MNILIVEDVDLKAAEVSMVLNLKVPNAKIQRARSFRSGIQLLEKNNFDLLILDMVLPVRDGEPPVDYGGKNVLSEIHDGTSCRHPSHIICLTAYEQVADSFRDEASKKLVHVVLYNETGTHWRDALAGKAVQIQKRIDEANLFPVKYGLDLAIVTSSPLVELQEVVKLPGFQGEFHQQDMLHYYSSTWESKCPRRLSVVACAAPTMGMTAASITACKVINRWRPRYLVMTGIAAATKKELNFGDVLVAEAVYDYGSGKITESDTDERIFTPSYSQIPLDTSLHALLQRWERDQLETDVIRRAWHSPEPNSPIIKLGLLASGAAVVQSKELVQQILEQSRKVVGLEMEAFGIMHAGKLASVPAPKVLIAKAVSDFADNKKRDKWQQYAAFTSARFIFEFFTKETELSFEE